MSDCFDHHMDAMEDAMHGGYSYNDGAPGAGPPDPLFYFTKINAKMLRKHGKAYLVEFSGAEMWLPISICKKITKDSMYVHTKIFKKIAAAWQEKNRPVQ